jgi:hypothetical protein
MAAGTFNIYGKSEQIGKVKFEGANDIGPQLVVELNKVMFRPANLIGLITDEWGQLQLTGTVLVDDTGVFGIVTHPDSGAVSPLVDMYYIGKGVVSIQLEGESTYRDVGNVPVFEFTPDITTLPHYSSRYGVRSKDLEVITEKNAEINITLDEFTYENLMLALLGDPVVIPLAEGQQAA